MTVDVTAEVSSGTGSAVARAALQEARSRKVLLAGVAVSVGFVGLFWLGFSLAFGSLQADDIEAFDRVLAATLMTVLGLYAVQFLASFLSILLASGSVAGEISADRVLVVLARPLPRWSWLAQRAGAFALLAVVYVTVMAGGVLLVATLIGDYRPISPTRGLLLLGLQVAVLMSLGVALSTRLSTVASGVVVVALYGLAWLAGIMEFVGAAIDNPAVERIGVAVSLLMPSDAVWRGASYYLQPAAFLLSPDIDGGIPFASTSPPSGALIAWALLYVVVCAAVAARSLARRDL